MTDHRVIKVEIVISTLLRVGVVASVAVVALGTLLSFAVSPRYAATPEVYQALVSPEVEFPHSISATLDGVLRLDGRSLVVLGLLLLIATPVVRVAVSILAFYFQRDVVYVVITSAVLLLLITSFILGKVE